jgi:hypothetical protein
MTINEFNSLDELKQYETVWKYGVTVGDRVDGQQKIFLWQLFSFYVELYYDDEYNVLLKLKSFNNTEKLDIYLTRYNLNELTDEAE